MHNTIRYVLLLCCTQLLLAHGGIAQNRSNAYQPNSLLVKFVDGMQADKQALFTDLGANEQAFYPKLNISHIELDTFPITTYDELGNPILLNNIIEVQGHITLRAEVDGAGLNYQVAAPLLNSISTGVTVAPLPYCNAVDIYCDSRSLRTKKALKIGVIDTGMDIWMIQDLVQSNNYPQNYFQSPIDLDFTSPSYFPIDDHGHGTQMASIITTILANQNIADYTLYPLKALGSDGTGYLSDIIAAIEFAICEQLDVLNLSFGYIPNDANLDGIFLRAVLLKAVSNNILPIVSAGNQSLDLDNNPYYPASLDVRNMLTVGATDCAAGDAFFSNYGEVVNLKSPGTDVLCQTLNEEWVLAEGTSHAAAITTAIVVQLAEYQTEFDARQIVCILEWIPSYVIDADLAATAIIAGYCSIYQPTLVPLQSSSNDNINMKSRSYPNPTTDILHIPYQFPEDGQEGELHIYTQHGILIQRTPIKGGSKGILTLPVHWFAEGSYFYRIVTAEKSLSTQQFHVLR